MKTKYLNAIEYLEGDYVLNAPLIEALKLNEAKIVNFDADGVALMHKENVFMLSLNNDEALAKYVDLINLSKLSLFYGCTNPDTITKIAPKVNHVSPCWQIIYTLAKAPKIDFNADFRLLDETHAQFVYENYTLRPQSVESILKLIRRKYMYGAFVNEKLAGFVGRHQDGSMGLLEVLPDFRRQGLGRALESFIIDVVLKEGRVPFAHVKTDNNVSRSLQSTIDGLKFADKLAVWFAIREK